MPNRRLTTQPRQPVIAAFLLAFFCLAVPGQAQSANSPTRKVTDELGRTIVVPEQIDRIVSLAPSLTEMVYALGLGDKLVGVSNFCDFPPDVKNKRRVGQPMNPSLEVIVELRPDVVLGSSTANDVHTVEGLDRLRIPLYGVTDPRTIDDILVSIQKLAALLGAKKQGGNLIKDLQQRLQSVEERVNGKPRPQALLAIWLEPLIAAGGSTFLNDVLRRVGADSITADLPGDWPRVSLETIVERNPDVLIFTSAHGVKASFERLRGQSPWRDLTAVRENRVIYLDEALFRPGPRIVTVMKDLARKLHPPATSDKAGRR